ncbi:MAG TPA: pyrroline-5-carboxylate reductase [Gammaproteobacteria bacterium]
MSRILLIGFGNMGQALAKGWLARGVLATDIAVVEPQSTAQAAARALGLTVIPTDALGTHRADVIVIAVKPAQVAESVAPLGKVSRDCVVLSIAAGKTTAGLRKLLGKETAVVRAMPNTPAAIGEGITALFASESVTAAERRTCEELMAAVGRVEWFADEALMDAVTAVSGSGPAYVFLLIECLAEAGREVGLAADVATRLATATVAGAGVYAREAELPAAELRRRVTSPKGTTEAALDVLLSEQGLAELMKRAVRAATARSRELSVD